MNKLFNKAVLNGTTVMGDGLTYPRIPNVYTGDNEGGYQRGDMMDANAVVEMIKKLTDTGEITIDELKNLINEEIQERVEGDQDQQRYTDEKIKDLIGTSPETLDTLKEIADALGEDPDFAANVWNKIAELTTKHDADIQELQDAITSGFENIDFTPYVKKTDVVTNTTNGLMLASDKTKLDSLPQYIVGHTNSSEARGIFKPLRSSYTIYVRYDCKKIGSNDEITEGFWLEQADQLKAGLMSSFDKKKLDYIEDYYAGNGIDITGHRISCTLDTSLYSIVTALPETGLPNKIYLLPSTETEEGNSYTEYGYVDNKWEEIGKYKADVDLSPYERALNLPSDVVESLRAQSGANYVNVYSYKQDLDRGQLREVSEFDIPKATSENAGIITAQDKTKLDGIEEGAQVNKIESISVNGTPLEITNKGVNIPSYELPMASNTTLGGVKVPEEANMIHLDLEGNLNASIALEYNKDSKSIRLYDRNGDSVSSIDCTDFIKDGMLESATVEVNPEGHDAGTYIKLVFNTDAGKDPVYINVSDLIHEYTAGDGIKLDNGKFSLDTIEHTERSYTTKLIGRKKEPALNIPIVDESGKLNKNILIPNVADLSNRTPTEWTGEIDDLGCIRYEDYKNISDYYYNFTKNIFFYPIQDNQLLMYNIGKGIADDKLSDFLKNPNNYDNWNIPVAIYLSDGLLASGGSYGKIRVHDPNDYSKVYYPGAVFGFKVNIDESKNNLLTFTEGEDYTDGFSPVMVNTKKLIVPKQSVIDTIVNSNEFKAKQDALTEVQLNNINNAITSISVNNIEQVNTNGAVNLTIPNASITEHGLMSKEDKSKLNSIIDWSDDNAGLLPIYNGDGSDGEWIYTHWIGAGQGTDNTWRKASDIILENITSDAILNNTPNATTVKAGLMSASDKTKLANPVSYYYRDLGVDTKLTDFSNNVCYVGSPVLEILGNKVKFEGAKLCTLNGIPFIDCSVPKAVASLLDGLMSKEDKAKLDSQPTIKASNATGVTDDDYIVIKKSELNSILSRLSALENKA